MDLTLSPEQEELRRAAQAFLIRCCPTAAVRRLRLPAADDEARELLRTVSELGWTGLAVPTSLGGGGGNLLDQAVLVEQLGQGLFPSLLTSSAVAALVIAAAASVRQAVRILPSILDGSSPATICWQEAPAMGVRLTTAAGGPTVDGNAGLVRDAMTAGLLVVPAEQVEGGGTRLLIIPTDEPGVHLQRTLTLDAARHARVSFTQVRVRPEHLLGGGRLAAESLTRGALAATALESVDMVGVASAALAMTTEYVKNRHQFGRPIGGFQAVRHHVADMATDLDAARLAAYQAISCWTDATNPGRVVAIAKVAANRAARHVTLMAHQLHGGIGYSLAHDLHLFSDRAAAAMLSFGTTDDHLAHLGSIMVAHAIGQR